MTNFPCFFKTVSRSVPVAVAALAISLYWVPAAAVKAAGTDGGNASKFVLGAGVAVTQKPYRGTDREVTGLPLIPYEDKWISLLAPTLDLKLYSSEAVSLRLRARYAGDGYEANDSIFLAGMDERKSSVWLGGAIQQKINGTTFSAEILGDASSHSNGFRAKLQADRRFMVGSIGVTPRLAAEWVDDKFVSYYYGVKSSEVRAGRGFYNGSATANVGAGLRVDYSPASRHILFLDLQVTRLGSAIKDSPLVDQAAQTTVSAGYLYFF